MRYVDLVKPGNKQNAKPQVGFKFPKPSRLAKRGQMRWGIELELVTVDEDDPREITNGFESLPKPWKHKGDGSIEPHGSGVEFYPAHPFVSLKEGFSAVRKLARYLRDDFIANASCGLHVHIDAQAFRSASSRQAFVQNIAGLEFLFYYALPKSRRERQYARPTSWWGIHPRERQRYTGINVCAYTKFRSLEFRYYNGTGNAARITRWVQLVWALYDLGITHPRKLTELTDVVNGAFLDGGKEKAWDAFLGCLPSLAPSSRHWRERLERFWRHHPTDWGTNYTNWRRALRLRMPQHSYAGRALLNAQMTIGQVSRRSGVYVESLRGDFVGQERLLATLSR